MEDIPDNNSTPLGAVLGISNIVSHRDDSTEQQAVGTHSGDEKAVGTTQLQLANKGVFDSLASMIEDARAGDPLNDTGGHCTEEKHDFLMLVRKIRDCALIINSSIPSQVSFVGWLFFPQC